MTVTKQTAHNIRQDKIWKYVIYMGGVMMIVLTLSVALFLLYRGLGTFTTYNHSIFEFLFSTYWAPNDTTVGGGKVGAAVFIFGSIVTCFFALGISLPFSLAVAIFITEVSPKWGKRIFQPAIEVFVGIPSVVYGWLGLTILVPGIKELFQMPTGFSVLAAALVLGLMIFPTMTSIISDALRSVPASYRKASYALGATRWQTISQVVLGAAKSGILTGIILGLARAFGEALAVAMVIGKVKAFPTSLLSPTTNITSLIASDMGGAMDGGEYNIALWSLALLLFFITLFFIFLIHYVSKRGAVQHDG